MPRAVGARRSLGVLLVGLLLAGWALVVAPAASAHNVLRGTDPADGSTVDVAPGVVTLTFDQPALSLGTEILVEGPDGTVVSTGDPVLVDATVSQALAGTLPAGAYTVEWRVTSADGHPVSGTFAFTAQRSTTVDGAAAVPGADDDPTEGGSTPDGATSVGPESGTTPGGADDTGASDGATAPTDPGDGEDEPVTRGSATVGPPAWLLVGIGVVVLAAALTAWAALTRRRP